LTASFSGYHALQASKQEQAPGHISAEGVVGGNVRLVSVETPRPATRWQYSRMNFDSGFHAAATRSRSAADSRRRTCATSVCRNLTSAFDRPARGHMLPVEDWRAKQSCGVKSSCL
jgi:hypothetical protein